MTVRGVSKRPLSCAPLSLSSAERQAPRKTTGDRAMTVSLFSFVDIFSRALAITDHLLDKGLAHAQANGHSEQDMLNWPLIDGTHTPRFQIEVVHNFARQWPARAASL